MFSLKYFKYTYLDILHTTHLEIFSVCSSMQYTYTYASGCAKIENSAGNEQTETMRAHILLILIILT